MPLDREHLPRWAKFKSHPQVHPHTHTHTPTHPHLNADKVIAEHWLIKMDL